MTSQCVQKCNSRFSDAEVLCAALEFHSR